MAKPESPFVSVREAAKRAKRDYQTVKFWVESELLPSVPTPNDWRLIPRDALERFLLEGAPKTPAGAGGER